jgi:hypothetical protein
MLHKHSKDDSKLCSPDIFTIDSVLKKVKSYEGVKRVDVLFIRKITFYKDWLLREIDRRLANDHHY